MVNVSKIVLHAVIWAYASVSFVSLSSLFFMPGHSVAADGVPAEYYANYQIKTQRDAMINAFEQIQAAVRV